MEYNPKILQKTREKLERSGVSYVRTDSGIFKALKWCFYLSAAWASVFLIIMIASHALRLSYDEAIYSVGQLATLRNGLNTSSVILFFFINCIILTARKTYIISAPISFITSVAGIIFYHGIYADNLLAHGISSSFYVRHAIPLGLIALFSILIFILYMRERTIERKAYEKLSSSLYENYSQRVKRLSDDTEEIISLSDNEWDKFLNSSDLDFSPKKLKRSRKNKR